MTRRLVLVPALVAVLSLFILAVVGGAAAHGSKHKKKADFDFSEKVVLFAADGMRPDLVDRYAKKGLLPEMDDLMDDGLKGKNGLLQAFPPNTGVGWASLATGAWPSSHGSTNNTFHRTGETNFNNSTSFALTGVLQADTIAQAAERAGKKVVAMEWVAARGYTPALQGPVVDFRSFFGGRGVTLNFDIPGQTSGAFGVQYQQRRSPNATGWTNVPRRSALRSRPRSRRTTARSRATAYLGRVRLRLDERQHRQLRPCARRERVQHEERRAIGGRDARRGRLGGRQGDTRCRPLAGQDGRLLHEADRPRRRRRLGDVPPLLHVGAARERERTTRTARPARTAIRGRRSTSEFPTSTAADFAPLEAGIVDEDTYIEQGLMWKDAHWEYLEYIINDPGREARPAHGRQPDHGRVPAPVHGAHHAEGHRRETEPVLRRPHERRHPRRAHRDPRGLHPIGVPGGGQHARARA